ncbi:MAG: S8 family serine peptidase [Saprospiraceae bacterium]|nr:S8 family serine peptidase [Saprospiraceae bacterium]
MHKFTIFTLATVGLWMQQTFAQRDYSISLQSGPIPVPEFYQPSDISAQMLAAHQFKEYYYLVLQFHDVPPAAHIKSLELMGVELLEYIPHYAYIAKVPVNIDRAALGARALITLKPEYKLSQVLASGSYPAHAVTTSGIKIQIFPYKSIAAEALLESLTRSGFAGGEIQQNSLALTIAQDRIIELAKHPAVMHIDFPIAPPQPDGWTARTAQRLNLLENGPNLGYDGKGVAIATADDGSVFHEDFRGRITDFNNTYGGTHGDMVAGILVGAGNLNPLAMGMAPGADLFLYSIENYPHIENAAQNLLQNRVVITSTSYGEGCGGYYDQYTRQVDAQVFQNPVLLHVFSAGNSGDESCSNYGNFLAPDGGRFGNLTGGRKAFKNGITVGNVGYDDHVITSSSRGPTQDGRIKPDIMAHGQGNLSTDQNNGYQYGGGTSAAAPSLAGTAALLYQAYRELNGNQDPSSALIKAAMLNTADDLGNAGPDYITGWGRVHAGRALETLRYNWFTNGSVAHNATQTHNLTIPEKVQQVRVMIYWTDPEGVPLAGKSLVNDLDLSIQSPLGESYQPWVLSKALHRDSLNKPAYRGLDKVNNVEQITLDNPSAGTYSIKVKGHLVPKGPQNYVIVFYFLQNELSMTYPNGGEGFVPGETEVIRWDAFGNSGTFSLEYSANEGATWQAIASNIAGHLRHYDWQVPNMNTNKMRIRVKRNGKSAESANPFCIMALPDFNFFYVAPGTAAVRWRKVAGANLYDVYALGNKYMDLIGTTSDTSLNFNIANWQGNWYSVRARNTNGAAGRRANAKWYQHRPCEANLTLKLMFDLYPSETYWDIKDSAGRVWASGGPYFGVTPNSTEIINICLPYGCYNLNIYDRYSDGMCCGNGQGSYLLSNEAGTALASGGQFNDLKTNAFCVDQNTVNAPLIVQFNNVINASCFSEQNGAATATASGGTGNYTYAWSNGTTGASANGLRAGTYSVTVSDGRNQITTSVTISQPSKINVQLTPRSSSCSENNTNSVTSSVSGGTAPYTYRWSNGSQAASISNINPGSYYLTVTDANGCTQIAFANLQPTAPINLSLSAKNITCYGANDGSATANISGGSPPYSYAWSSGSTNATATGLGQAIHAVTVTDAQGCQATAAVNIFAPSAINVSYIATPALGANNGAINLSVNGGTPGYSFKWSNGATTEDLSNLASGAYTVTITDSKNCNVIQSIRVEYQSPTDCSARGSSTRFEWIESVVIAGLTNSSGNNNGYGNFTNLTQNLNAGSSYPVVLTPAYAASAFREFWRIWLDVNQDGDFADAGEEIFVADGFIGSISGTLRIPAHTLSGATKMRVAMRYGTPPLPCGTFAYGEVEDYSVFIVSGSNINADLVSARSNEILSLGTTAATNAEIFPNPAGLETKLRYYSRTNNTLEIFVVDALGRSRFQKAIEVTEGWNDFSLNVEQWKTGIYILKGKNAEEYFEKQLIISR